MDTNPKTSGKLPTTTRKQTDAEILAERRRKEILGYFTDRVDSQVPERYRKPFRNMPYSSKLKISAETWNKTVAHVVDCRRKYPEKGIVFYGPPGVGKTTLMGGCFMDLAQSESLLLVQGMSRKYGMYWEDAGQWIDKVLDFKYGRTTVKPRLYPGAITNASVPIALFFDEFDKAGSSVQKQEILDGFVRELNSKNALLFVTTNMTVEQFNDKRDPLHAHIIRRVTEDGDSIAIDLF